MSADIPSMTPVASSPSLARVAGCSGALILRSSMGAPPGAARALVRSHRPATDNTPRHLFGVKAVGASRVRRVATTRCLAAVLTVVLLASLPPPPAAASATAQTTGSERPAREGRSQRAPSEDLNCLGLDARDIGELRDDRELRDQMAETCRALATTKYADEKPLPFPLWVVVVAGVFSLVLTAGLVWYYLVKRGTDLPWFWQNWWWWPW